MRRALSPDFASDDDDSIAINDRFFIGGDTLRGFRSSGIGPRDLTTTAEDALGEDFLPAGSVELTMPLGLPEEIGVKGHVFTDAGSLWETM